MTQFVRNIYTEGEKEMLIVWIHNAAVVVFERNQDDWISVFVRRPPSKYIHIGHTYIMDEKRSIVNGG